MKRLISLLTALCICLSLSACGQEQPAAEPEEVSVLPYTDVAVSDADYGCLVRLYDLGVLLPGDTFGAEAPLTWGVLAEYLCQLDAVLFPDTHPDGIDAILWCAQRELLDAEMPGFDPEGTVTREQLCIGVMEYAQVAGITLSGEEIPAFSDEAALTPYGVSYAYACVMAGILSVYDENEFRPNEVMTRSDCTETVLRLLNRSGGSVAVDISPHAYDTQEYGAAFSSLVPASVRISPQWFNGVLFIGDSLTAGLRACNLDTGLLGGADYLCKVGLSQTGALLCRTGDPDLPEYPYGSGNHVRLEDGAAQSGADRFYIMLGVNCIANGVDKAYSDLVTLIDIIREKSPQATILVQSVLPITADSPVAGKNLNNANIRAYNDRVYALCKERGWYYLNVAEALTDSNGCLRADCCSDPAMGVHLNQTGAAVWTEYLLTHVPAALR